MKMIRLAQFTLIAALVAGCSSNPPREALPEEPTGSAEPATEGAGDSFVTLPDDTTREGEETAEQPGEEADGQPETATTASVASNDRQKYQALSTLPEAESRALKFSLGSQTFNYVENGEVVASGPIASGKASSPTPTGKYRILSKNKDKESSRYDNEIGTPAWMPYSMQFYGNYFMHEGYLPGHPASHGCIRLGHYDAKLLFERMKIGDPVVVAK